ncbi:cytochrome P450 [Fennellomyces sp. T-0311]|nr:cytochrome P450 [Fennellomyces sp. T-0311]
MSSSLPGYSQISKRIVTISTITGLSLSLLYFTIRKSWKESFAVRFNPVPSPRGALPYFGHFLYLNKSAPALKVHEWHKKYGPIICVHLGVVPWVILSDRRIAHDLLVRLGTITGDRPPSVFSCQHHGVNGYKGMAFCKPDKQWKRSRAEAQAILSQKSVMRLADRIAAESSRLVDFLLADSSKENGIEVLKYMQFMPLSVILEACFGTRSESLDDPVIRAWLHITNETLLLSSPTNSIDAFFPVLGRLYDVFIGKRARMTEFTNTRDPFMRKAIKDALDGDVDCFVKHLYATKDENEFDDDDILVILADIVNASSDTVAVTLSWGFSILCHHKETQIKLHKEIDAFINTYNRLPLFEERDHFPFLLSVQKECIRYRPTNHFGIPHVTTEDAVCNGYFIPKNTVIMTNTYSLTRNDTVYDNPDQFLPERYLDDMRQMTASVNAKGEHREQYMFGWGRRTCPGVLLAEVELFTMWIRVLATTTIGPAVDEHGEPVYPNLNMLHDQGLAVAPGDAYLRFIKRPNSLV